MTVRKQKEKVKKAKPAFTIDPELLQSLKEEAERESRPVSNMLNRILEDRYKPKK